MTAAALHADSRRADTAHDVGEVAVDGRQESAPHVEHLPPQLQAALRVAAGVMVVNGEVKHGAADDFDVKCCLVREQLLHALKFALAHRDGVAADKILQV